MSKYGYFLAIPINPSKMNKIFKDCDADDEKINAVIDYIVPVLRDIWEKTRKLPLIQTELQNEE